MPTILVIEDDDQLREAICDILMLEDDLQVIDARDGPIGIQMAHDHAPDVIVCDFRMPGMSGHDVLDAVRDDPALNKIPFILMTGQLATGSLVDHNPRPDQYIAKPFDPDDLVEIIRYLL